MICVVYIFLSSYEFLHFDSVLLSYSSFGLLKVTKMLSVKTRTLGKGIIARLPMMDILILCLVTSSQSLYGEGPMVPVKQPSQSTLPLPTVPVYVELKDFLGSWTLIATTRKVQGKLGRSSLSN